MSNEQKTFITRLLATTLIVILGTAVAVVGWRETYDDAYITYRYAYNFATGQGLVYNPGEWFMGTTAPLYGLMLGFLGAIINPEAIPAMSGIISCLALMLTGLALYEYGRLHQQSFCGFLGGVFYVANPLLAMTFGGEILFQVMLIAWAFVFYRKKRTLAAALLSAIAILIRPDGVIAAGVMGVHYLVTRRRLPIREMIAMALVITPFMALAWISYGSPLPGTLQAKVAQGASGFWLLFGKGTLEWLRGFTLQGSSPIYTNLPAIPSTMRFIPFILIGIPATLAFFRFQILPLTWGMLYALAYYLLNVPFYHWYIVPIILALMIVAAAGVAGAIEIVRRTYRRLSGSRYRSWAVSLFMAVCFLALSPGLYAEVSYIRNRAANEPNPSEVLYERAGEWLKANTQPTDRIGYIEIGYLGYYSRRPIIDALGLVTPEVTSHIAARNFGWAYARYRPEYVIINQTFQEMAEVKNETWFQEEYREIFSLSQPGYPTPLVIYRRLTPER
jgi:arabinofuranosyltransferase